jgi:hypothetical protein
MPCRLMALPPNVLWHITRKMGRRCRVWSKALQAAYGPLDCGLELPATVGLGELQRMLGARGQHLQHITSLQLYPPAYESRPAERLVSIFSMVPHLGALHITVYDADLHALAPLRGTLTALTVVVKTQQTQRGGADLRGLARLTALRSLSITVLAEGPEEALALQHALGSLTQVVDLTWGGVLNSGWWTPQWLAGVRSSMPQLASLCLCGPPEPQDVWDDGDTVALQQAVAGLRSFTLRSMGMLSGEPSLVVAALSQCTGVACMHLMIPLHRTCQGSPPDLLQLSRLRLASLQLWVQEDSAAPSQAGPLLQALGALSHLTNLDVKYVASDVLSGPPQLPSSLVELQVGGDLEPSTLLPPLQALRGLTKLSLPSYVQCRRRFWSPATAEQLSTLTQLRSLSLAVCFMPPGWLAALPGLTALRELQLQGAGWNWMRMVGRSFIDEDLLHLAPLRGLTCLLLGELGQVSAPGLLALLDALPNLQQLELDDALQSAAAGEALVEGLVARVLPRLARLQLLSVQLPERACDALLSAAEAHGCRCCVVPLVVRQQRRELQIVEVE